MMVEFYMVYVYTSVEFGGFNYFFLTMLEALISMFRKQHSITKNEDTC